MNPYRKLIKNSVIFTIANFGSKLLSFVLVPYYTYVLSTHELGTADALINTVALILPIISLYIQDAVLRFVMEKSHNNQSILNIAIKLFTINFIISLVAIPILLLFNVNKNYIFILYFVLFFQGIYNIIGQYVRGKGQIAKFAIGGVINTCILLVSNILMLTVFHMGIVGYLLSYLFSYIVSSVYYSIVGKIKICNISIKQNKTLTKEMLIYCIPLIPNALMWWIMNISDRYMIIFFISTSASGIYTVAHKIPTAINMITSIFSQAWQLSAIEEKDSSYKENFFSKVFNLYALVICFCSTFIIAIAKTIINFIIEKSYYSSAESVPFLMLAMIFSSFAAFLGTIYASEKKTKNAMVSTIIGAVVNIIANLLFIPEWGVIGASLGTMIALMVLFIFRAIDTKKYVKISYNKGLFISFFIISLVQIILFYSKLKHVEVFNLCLSFIFIIINRKLLKQVYSFIKNKRFKND